METIVDRARLYIGKQETLGPNDGPNIRIWKALLGPGVANAVNVFWCSVFVFAMFLERNGLSRKQLVAKLGFRPDKTFPESCDSLLAECHAVQIKGLGLPRTSEDIRIVSSEHVRAGDVGFMMKKLPDGTYSKTDARHIYIVTGPPSGGLVPTIEGNTTPGMIEGEASRNGDGTYERFRSIVPKGRTIFVRFPSSLTGF